MKSNDKKQNPQQIAQSIKDKCAILNWSYSVRGSIFTITKKITPNNNDAFCAADSEYYEILSLLPSTSAGSIWGTDGGGIGAITAMQNGVFKMNKSGGSKAVLKQLNK